MAGAPTAHKGKLGSETADAELERQLAALKAL